ncbi:MAG: hypothetical protein WDZ35_13320 [Crocinitomicaceae bacterium]
MTIVRENFFKIVFLLLASFSLVACSITLKKDVETVHFDKTHSRALDVSDSLTVVAGSAGKFTLYNTVTLEIILQDSLLPAEDIRDVEILANGDILFLNSGEKGIIWKYKAAEDIIEKVFHQDNVFLDGLSFWDGHNGIAYGDPVNDKFFILLTENGGESWKKVQKDKIPEILSKEAGFAASGTGIVTVGDSAAYIASGISDTARLYRTFDRGKSWDVVNTPMKSGDSYGIYSTYFWTENEGIVVGGSYLYPGDNDSICYRTNDAGLSWKQANKGLGGYCSCVHGTENGNFLIATGRTGTYYSLNKGKRWKKLLDDKFYTVKVYKGKLYFSGKDGRFAVYSYKIQ